MKILRKILKFMTFYRLSAHQIYKIEAFQKVFECFLVIFHGEIEETEVGDRLHCVMMV